jgi:hypothetical protein
MLISRVAKAFKKHGVPFGVVGGYAVALHGAVRGTVDLDLVLRLRRKDFVAAAEALAGLGLQPKLPVTAGEVFDFREDYIARRNLVAWSFWNPTDPSEMVDVVITHDLDKMDIVTMRLVIDGSPGRERNSRAAQQFLFLFAFGLFRLGGDHQFFAVITAGRANAVGRTGGPAVRATGHRSHHETEIRGTTAVAARGGVFFLWVGHGVLFLRLLNQFFEFVKGRRGRFGGAPAGALVQVSSAAGAQTPAGGPTEGLGRQGQQQALADFVVHHQKGFADGDAHVDGPLQIGFKSGQAPGAGHGNAAPGGAPGVNLFFIGVGGQGHPDRAHQRGPIGGFQGEGRRRDFPLHRHGTVILNFVYTDFHGSSEKSKKPPSGGSVGFS